MGEGDHHVLRGDQVLQGQVHVIGDDLAAARVGVLVADRFQLFADDLHELLGAGQDVEQPGDVEQDLLELGEDLVLLQAGELLQAQVEDRLGLDLAQVIAVVLQAEPRGQVVRAGVAGPGALEHGDHGPRVPGPGDEPGLGLRRAGGGADQHDDLVDIGQGDGLTLQDVGPIPGLAQLVEGAAGDHVAPMAQEVLDELLEVQGARLAVHQGDHVDAEDRLQLAVLEQVVQHHLGDLVAFEIEDHAHAVLVGLVAHLRDALDLLLLHQLGDALEHARLVDLIRDLGDDDGLAVAALLGLDVGAGTHHDPAAAGAVALADAADAVDDGRGGEVRPRDVLHEVVDREGRVVDQGQAGVADLAQVVRRDIGGHAHRDARGAVDQQVGDAAGQDRGLLLLVVVVRDEIDGLLVDVLQQGPGDLGHAALGVPIGRRRVAVHRAEVALAVDEHVAQREGLGHAHQGVVGRRIAVGVVLTEDVTDHAGALDVGSVPDRVALVHGEQDAPVHRLEPVAHVGQGAADDDAHGVVEIGATHLVLDANRDDFSCEIRHRCGEPPVDGRWAGSRLPAETLGRRRCRRSPGAGRLSAPLSGLIVPVLKAKNHTTTRGFAAPWIVGVAVQVERFRAWRAASSPWVAGYAGAGCRCGRLAWPATAPALPRVCRPWWPSLPSLRWVGAPTVGRRVGPSPHGGIAEQKTGPCGPVVVFMAGRTRPAGLALQDVAALVVLGEVQTLGLFLFADAQPDDDIDHLEDDEAHDRGVDQGHQDALALDHDLAGDGHALGQAGTAQALGGEDAGQHGADDTADAMHAEDVQGVVIAEHALELGRGDEADHAGCDADDQRTHGPDGAGGRGDGDQAGDGAGGDTQHAGLAVGHPLREHPGQRRGGGGDLGDQHGHAGTSVGGQRRCRR